MDFQTRYKPRALILLELLKIRKKLSLQEEKDYYQLEKGYEGEVLFDSMIEKSLKHAIILKDLLFTVNGTTFQIDTLAVMRDKLIIYEVKNYEQEYKIVEDDLISCQTNIEIINPLIQLKRASVLMKQLLTKINLKVSVDPYVVFVNPNFTLFQSEPHKNILVTSQLKTHFKQINKGSKPTNREVSKTVEQIIGCVCENPIYHNLPVYSREQLTPGMTCRACQSFQVFIQGRRSICQECFFSERAYDNAKRQIEEFVMLFPDKPLTTKVIKKWSKDMHSDYRIRTILKRDYGYMAKD